MDRGLAGAVVNRAFRLPPAFYYDHISRDLPEEGETRIVRETKSSVVVEMDRPAYDDLLSDARHYATSMAEGGFEGRGLIASARATLKRLEAEPWPTPTEGGTR